MKTTIILILSLFSFQLPATTACKCNCDMTDRRVCASSYDLEHPCPGARCPNEVARTACITMKVFNQYKGVYEWQSYCRE